jgi:hypothetical protein
VHEDPFGTDIDRALRSIGRRIRKLAHLGRTEAVRRAFDGGGHRIH